MDNKVQKFLDKYKDVNPRDVLADARERNNVLLKKTGDVGALLNDALESSVFFMKTTRRHDWVRWNIGSLLEKITPKTDIALLYHLLEEVNFFLKIEDILRQKIKFFTDDNNFFYKPCVDSLCNKVLEQYFKKSSFNAEAIKEAVSLEKEQLKKQEIDADKDLDIIIDIILDKEKRIIAKTLNNIKIDTIDKVINKLTDNGKKIYNKIIEIELFESQTTHTLDKINNCFKEKYLVTVAIINNKIVLHLDGNTSILIDVLAKSRSEDNEYCHDCGRAEEEEADVNITVNDNNILFPVAITDIKIIYNKIILETKQKPIVFTILQADKSLIYAGTVTFYITKNK